MQKLQADLAKARSKSPRPDQRTDGGILDFVREASPQLDPPIWFAPYVAKLETAIGGGYELCFSAPPQHGKTVITAHALVWALRRWPLRRFAYGTYNRTRASSVARYVRSIAASVGLDLTGTLEHVYGPRGGGIIFAGRGTAITGEPIDGFSIVDDPLKGAAEAESAAIRETCYEWHGRDWCTRHHPGTSMFIMATRWHPQDLIGRRIDEGWDWLNLPAIAEDDDPLGRDPGEALSPRWPIGALLRQRRNVSEYGWAALYQGRPRPRGGKLFEGATLAESMPTTGWRVAIGLDLAYSKKTHADYSVAVVMATSAEDGKTYVVDVIREQSRATEFADCLKPVLARYPGVLPRWYCAGPEMGIADFLSEKTGRNIEAIAAHTDKFTRAQPLSAAWNAKQILVPSDRSWADAFVAELRDFTGLEGEHDDQVDAAVAAYDALKNSVAASEYSSFTADSDW